MWGGGLREEAFSFIRLFFFFLENHRIRQWSCWCWVLSLARSPGICGHGRGVGTELFLPSAVVQMGCGEPGEDEAGSKQK